MATIVHLLGVENLNGLETEQLNLLRSVLAYKMRELTWDKNTETSKKITEALVDALIKIKKGEPTVAVSHNNA